MAIMVVIIMAVIRAIRVIRVITIKAVSLDVRLKPFQYLSLQSKDILIHGKIEAIERLGYLRFGHFIRMVPRLNLLSSKNLTSSYKS